MNDTERAYLAGFFDGEGTVGMYGSDLCLTVRVANTDRASLERFVSAFGGKVRMYPARARRQPCYDWVIYGGDAKAMLGELLPFLSVKKAQAFEALKLPIFGRTRNRYAKPSDDELRERAAIAARIKNLKKAA